jgi:hypothetical protein
MLLQDPKICRIYRYYLSRSQLLNEECGQIDGSEFEYLLYDNTLGKTWKFNPFITIYDVTSNNLTSFLRLRMVFIENLL